MVAKSLLTFVSVGLVSGLALGVYLVDVKDMLYTGTASMSAVEGPSISVIPTKALYDEGERVIFRIVNTGTVPLHSGDNTDRDLYGATISGLSGIVLYTFDVIDVMWQNDTFVSGADGYGLSGNNDNSATGDISSKSPMLDTVQGTALGNAQKVQVAPPLPQGTFDGHAAVVDVVVVNDNNERIDNNYIVPIQDTGVFYELLPGHEIMISWDQTKHDGDLVKAGLYKINVRASSVNASDAPQTIVADSITFTIQ